MIYRNATGQALTVRTARGATSVRPGGLVTIVDDREGLVATHQLVPASPAVPAPPAQPIAPDLVVVPEVVVVQQVVPVVSAAPVPIAQDNVQTDPVKTDPAPVDPAVQTAGKKKQVPAAEAPVEAAEGGVGGQ